MKREQTPMARSKQRSPRFCGGSIHQGERLKRMALFRFQSAENFAVAVDETIRTVKWLFRRRTLDLFGFQWRRTRGRVRPFGIRASRQAQPASRK